MAGSATYEWAVRDWWAYMVIYCGHLTEQTATFREEDLAGEDRAHWYARQVTGSGNFEIGGLGHVLSGHLGFPVAQFEPNQRTLDASSPVSTSISVL